MNPFNPTLGLDTNTLKGSRGRLGVQFLGPRLAVLPYGKVWLPGRSTNKRGSLRKTIQMIILIKKLTIKKKSTIIKTQLNWNIKLLSIQSIKYKAQGCSRGTYG